MSVAVDQPSGVDRNDEPEEVAREEGDPEGFTPEVPRHPDGEYQREDQIQLLVVAGIRNSGTNKIKRGENRRDGCSRPGSWARCTR